MFRRYSFSSVDPLNVATLVANSESKHRSSTKLQKAYTDAGGLKMTSTCATERCMKYDLRSLTAEGPGKRLPQLHLAVPAVQPALDSHHTLLRHLFLLRRARIATGLTVCVWRPTNQRVAASHRRERTAHNEQTVSQLEKTCDSNSGRVVRVVHDHGTGGVPTLAAAARVVSFVHRQASTCIPHLAVGAVELVEHPRVNTRAAETVGDEDSDDEPSHIIQFPVPVHGRRASAALTQLVRLHAFRSLRAPGENHRRM